MSREEETEVTNQTATNLSEAAQPTSPPPAPAPTSPRQDPGRLERQTVVMVNDRGRLALLVALCTLAGVAVGFGLSTLIAGSRADCSRASSDSAFSRARIEGLLPGPTVVTPRFHGFGFHCHHGHCRGAGNGWGVFLDSPDLANLEDLAELEGLDDLRELFDADHDTAWLGVNIVSVDSGARVIQVSPDSPASRAGLHVDDVIVAFDGEPVGSASKLVRLVRSAEPGEEVRLGVRRGDGNGASANETRTLEARLATAPGTALHGRSR